MGDTALLAPGPPGARAGVLRAGSSPALLPGPFPPLVPSQGALARVWGGKWWLGKRPLFPAMTMKWKMEMLVPGKESRARSLPRNLYIGSRPRADAAGSLTVFSSSPRGRIALSAAWPRPWSLFLFLNRRVCACAHVHVYVRVCMCMCMCMCVRVRACACGLRCAAGHAPSCSQRCSMAAGSVSSGVGVSPGAGSRAVRATEGGAAGVCGELLGAARLSWGCGSCGGCGGLWGGHREQRDCGGVWEGFRGTGGGHGGRGKPRRHVGAGGGAEGPWGMRGAWGTRGHGAAGCHGGRGATGRVGGVVAAGGTGTTGRVQGCGAVRQWASSAAAVWEPPPPGHWPSRQAGASAGLPRAGPSCRPVPLTQCDPPP